MEVENAAGADATTSATNPDKSRPKPRSRGVYVSVLDPYMIGSTDYAETMEIVDQVCIVCGKEQVDDRVCGGRLDGIRMSNSGTGGALRFKVLCTRCGEECKWGADLRPTRDAKGRFTKKISGTYCSIGERILYSVRHCK